MSDDESKNPVEKVPEGMVRKRRKVRRKRRSNQGSVSANRVFEKGKDLLFGMQKDEGEQHVDVAEQLRRLKQDADDDKPLDDVWGTKRRSSSWLWILLLGIIMPLIIIGIIISKLTQNPNEGPGVELKDGVGVPKKDFSASDGPNGWFLGDSESVTSEVIRILNALNDAKTLEEVEPFIRQSPYRSLNPISLDRLANPFIAETISDFELIIGISKPGGSSDAEERGFLSIEGKHEDGQAFTAYFVEEEVEGDKKVLLDWDATTGWGEVKMKTLVETKPRNEVLIRCLIEKKAIYDVEFGDVVYSGYILSDREDGEYSFAYVPLSSKASRILDGQLKGVLDYGNFILPLRENEPVTLGVRFGNEKGTSSVFEITSLEHESWVRP